MRISCNETRSAFSLAASPTRRSPEDIRIRSGLVESTSTRTSDSLVTTSGRASNKNGENHEPMARMRTSSRVSVTTNSGYLPRARDNPWTAEPTRIPAIIPAPTPTNMKSRSISAGSPDIPNKEATFSGTTNDATAAAYNTKPKTIRTYIARIAPSSVAFRALLATRVSLFISATLPTCHSTRMTECRHD